MRPIFEGASEEELIPSRRLRRDTLTPVQRALAVLASRQGLVAVIVVCALLGIVVPTVTPLCLIAGVLTAITAALNHRLWRATLPFRLPQETQATDYNDPKPGRQACHRARGVAFLGNAWPQPGEAHGPELWLSFEDLLRHMLVLGSTGSGKTEFLVGFMLSAGLGIGSGGVYVDPKGEYKLAAQIFVLSRLLGRDDDFRVLNFQTGGKRHNQRSCRRLSNTTNPISFGTPENIAQMILSLIPEPSGENAVFVQSAQALMQAEIYAIADLRDQGVPVSIATIREYLDPDRFAALAHDPRVKEHNRTSMLAFMGGVQWREDPMWQIVQARLRQASSRADALPQALAPAARAQAAQAAGADQTQQTLEPWYQQFGYARSYFNQLMNSLADTYGHIYAAARSEVDMPDIIQQRRILVALLPSLEKSPAETRSIGKLTLSMLRNGVSAGLGSRAMGMLRDVIYSRPSSALKPFPVATDEYAAMQAEGYELMLTQGRAFGIAGAIGNQDYAGLTKAGAGGSGQASAAQIVANTQLKIAMKTNDPQETWNLLEALAGEAEQTKVQRYARPRNEAAHYSRIDDVDVRRESRIDLRDLQQQIEGEFHAFMNGRVVRGYAFHANPPLKEDFQLIVQEMLQVLPPQYEHLEQRHGAPKRLAERLATLIVADEEVAIDDSLAEQLAPPREVFARPGELDRMDTAIAAVCHWVEMHRLSIERRDDAHRLRSRGADVDADGVPVDGTPEWLRAAARQAIEDDRNRAPSGTADAFGGVPPSGDSSTVHEAISAQQIAAAASRSSRTILDGLAGDLVKIEEALGRDADEALAISEQFAHDVERALDYPGAPPPEEDSPARLREAIERLIGAVDPGRSPSGHE